MKKRRLILFTRLPLPGAVKTRMIPILGKQRAAVLHREITEHNLKTARSAAEKNSAALEIRYRKGDKDHIRQWLGPKALLAEQRGNDPGERMANAFQENFRMGAKQVAWIETDSSFLSVYHIRKTFDLLNKNEMVLGPSQYGGYYLIGLKHMVPEIFEGIAWGTDKVFDTLLRKAKEQGLSFANLGILPEVDRPEDLDVWKSVRDQKISIIIPTRNDEDYLGNTLDRIKASDMDEIKVIDGESTDKTIKIASKWGAEVISTSPDWARQMNLGAKFASGDILLFLNAGTLLPVNYGDHIRQILEIPEFLGGYFNLRFRPSSFILRIKEFMIFLRNKLFRMPFSDQAIFVRTSIFHEMNGFSEASPIEDVEFMRRLRSMGKTVSLQVPVITSGFRYKQYSALRGSLKNKLVYLGYFLGIPSAWKLRKNNLKTKNKKSIFSK